jgi:hypothetical protein
MNSGALREMGDGELVDRLRRLVADERVVTAAVLAHLAEVEARQLYLPAACSSMHVYCTRVLGFSEHAAFKRIRVARAGRRFPVLLEAIAAGNLHVSGAMVIAPHLKEENVEELVREASGKSRAEIEVLVARRAPRSDVAPRIEPVAAQGELGTGGQVAPGRVTTTRIEPLAPERFEVRVTVSGATRDKLERARALMRHQVPSGDVAEVLDRALDALLVKIEKQKFGKAERPRVARKSGSRRYVPRAVRREVIARDGERCAFVSEDGRRCEETGFLEMDHVTAVALGGDGASAGRVRILCRAHNQYEAARQLGQEAVDAGRAAKEMERDVLGGLRRMGVSAADARYAFAISEGATAEQRIVGALRALHAVYARRKGARCQEGRARYGAVTQRPAWQRAVSGVAQRQRERVGQEECQAARESR